MKRSVFCLFSKETPEEKKRVEELKLSAEKINVD